MGSSQNKRDSRTPLARRIDRALDAGHDTQPRHGRCVVCLADWDTCSHSRREVDDLIAARKMQRTMKSFGG